MTDLGGKSRRYRPKVQYSFSAQAGKLRYFSDYNGTLIERIRRRRAAQDQLQDLCAHALGRDPRCCRAFTLRLLLRHVLSTSASRFGSCSFSVSSTQSAFLGTSTAFPTTSFTIRTSIPSLLNRLFSILESITVGFSQIFYECIHMQHHKANPHSDMMEITPRISDKRADTRQ